MKRAPSVFAATVAAATLSLAAVAAVLPSSASAQMRPGQPNGILQDTYHWNQHPQMEFAASEPTGKFQNKVTADRRKGDSGDPNGCNLQCPSDSN